MDREPGTLDFVDWPEAHGSWHDEAAHRDFIARRTRGPYPSGMGYWVITHPEDPGRFLGWVLLIPVDGVGPEVELGWRVPTAHRGKGYAPEAAARLLTYGFADLSLRRIVADVHTENAASRRVAEKIGMSVSGLTPDAPHALRYTAQMACRI